MTTIQSQIDELNSQVKCTIRPSPVNGIGVFAIRDIMKGEKLNCVPTFERKWYNVPYEDFGKIFPAVREIILQRWCAVINGEPFQSPNSDVTLVLFMNHSFSSNYDGSTDTALKDIKKDEEVLSDYRMLDNYKKVFPWIVD